jgi:hypothetical protein
MSIKYYENRPEIYRNSNVSYDLFNQRINRYFDIVDGYTYHRSPLKLLMNPILRIIQFWTNYLYVITSEYNTYHINGHYFIQYRFMRVKQLIKIT